MPGETRSAELRIGRDGRGIAPRSRAVQTHGAVNIVRVPYKGQGAAVLGLLGGEVQVGFASSGSVPGTSNRESCARWPITTAKRSVVAPGLPTVAESGLPGYQSATNAGMFAPVRTPDRLIASPEP